MASRSTLFSEIIPSRTICHPISSYANLCSNRHTTPCRSQLETRRRASGHRHVQGVRKRIAVPTSAPSDFGSIRGLQYHSPQLHLPAVDASSEKKQFMIEDSINLK